MRRFRVVVEFELLDKSSTVADAATLISSAVAESGALTEREDSLLRFEIVEVVAFRQLD